MSQLVGVDCALCGQRIASVLGAGFCTACSCPVHDKCRHTATVETGCPACGGNPANPVAEQMRSDRTKELSKKAPPFKKTIREFEVAVGVFAGVVGFAAFRSFTSKDPVGDSRWWTHRALDILIVAIAGFAIFFARKKKQPVKDKEETET